MMPIGVTECPSCGAAMFLADEDIIIEEDQIIGDWRCPNGHVRRVVKTTRAVRDPDGYDRNGVLGADGQVYSDADPGL